MNDDTISRQAAIDATLTFIVEYCGAAFDEDMQKMLCERLDALPSTQSRSAEKDIRAMCGECDAWNIYKNYLSAQPEHLTDDDFETIRIHLDAYKERLCNQGRWKEAKEYQRIYDRFMAFASAQPEIIRCEDCMHNGSFDTDCPIEWNGKEYCSFAERKDEKECLD